MTYSEYPHTRFLFASNRKLQSPLLLQTRHLPLRAIEREGGGGERESRVSEGDEQDFPVLVD